MAVLYCLILFCFLLSRSFGFTGESSTDVYATNTSSVNGPSFTNPIRKMDGSDPFIIYSGGYYYLMSTTWKDVQLTRAKTINGLKNGETKVVYNSAEKSRCCNVWAPEIHDIDGTWHIYFTAGEQKDLGKQRSHVLKGGSLPWDNYQFAGTVVGNEWAIDGTVAVINKQRYFIYSCQRANLQSLCIAPMLSATKIGSARMISAPTLPWEKVGKFPVNEGPAVMENNGRYFMSFSASYCWTTSYTLGLLTLKSGADPVQQSSWIKSGPALSSANGNLGPGHNGFFKSPDGKEWWNVYHATASTEGACDGNRYTMVDVVKWDKNGNPLLEAPPKLESGIREPSGGGA